LRDQLAVLFEGHTDAVEVIKWKELYETMEAVTDRCEDVVNVIRGYRPQDGVRARCRA
jgi:hypothetical protein